MKLSGWGRYPTVECKTSSQRNEAAMAGLVRSGPVIARGNGRSYGDSSLNSHRTIDMRRMSRMMAFDETSGQLTAEAVSWPLVSSKAIIRLMRRMSMVL